MNATEQIAARALTNAALAARLDLIRLAPRRHREEQRNALLEEAARRLRQDEDD